MADGFLNKCKECTKKDNRANRLSKEGYYKEYDRKRANLPHRVKARQEYQKTDSGKKAGNKAKLNFIVRNPKKRQCHVAVHNALRDGVLVKRPCEVCGAENVEAHHNDYNKPLEVRWLCKKHHDEWHRHNSPIE